MKVSCRGRLSKENLPEPIGAAMMARLFPVFDTHWPRLLSCGHRGFQVSTSGGGVEADP